MTNWYRAERWIADPFNRRLVAAEGVLVLGRVANLHGGGGQ